MRDVFDRHSVMECLKNILCVSLILSFHAIKNDLRNPNFRVLDNPQPRQNVLQVNLVPKPAKKMFSL